MKRVIALLVLLGMAACDDGSEHSSLNNTSSTNNINNTNNTNNTNQPDFVPVDYGHLFPEPFRSQEVVWEPCRLDDRDESSQAECADLVVPVHWDEPEGEVTTIHLKRLAGIASPRRRLFMLQGGPGGSSTIDFPPSMMEMHLADFSLDIIAVDHRGTGYSDYLLCPDQMTAASEAGSYVTGEELFACAETEIASRTHYYSGFTISNAARDVGLAVELLKEPASDSFVYGVSYGSTWAHRYAQLFPNQSRSVILDSLAIAG